MILQVLSIALINRQKRLDFFATSVLFSPKHGRYYHHRQSNDSAGLMIYCTVTLRLV